MHPRRSLSTLQSTMVLSVVVILAACGPGGATGPTAGAATQLPTQAAATEIPPDQVTGSLHVLDWTGYDAEWVHMFVRLVFGTRTIIPAEHGRPSQTPPVGYHRRLMRSRFNKKKYGQRWQVETVISMIKRRLSEATGARRSACARTAGQPRRASTSVPKGRPFNRNTRAT